METGQILVDAQQELRALEDTRWRRRTFVNPYRGKETFEKKEDKPRRIVLTLLEDYVARNAKRRWQMFQRTVRACIEVISELNRPLLRLLVAASVFVIAALFLVVCLRVQASAEINYFIALVGSPMSCVLEVVIILVEAKKNFWIFLHFFWFSDFLVF